MEYKHVIVTAAGGPEVLQVREEKVLPAPAEGEVRVRVAAAGTGFTDTIIREGQYPGVKQKPPFTLGYDWFGVVDEIGPGVSGIEPGQAVADMPVIGGYTQYLCVDEQVVQRGRQGSRDAKPQRWSCFSQIGSHPGKILCDL